MFLRICGFLLTTLLMANVVQAGSLPPANQYSLTISNVRFTTTVDTRYSPTAIKVGNIKSITESMGQVLREDINADGSIDKLTIYDLRYLQELQAAWSPFNQYGLTQEGLPKYCVDYEYLDKLTNGWTWRHTINIGGLKVDKNTARIDFSHKKQGTSGECSKSLGCIVVTSYDYNNIFQASITMPWGQDDSYYCKAVGDNKGEPNSSTLKKIYVDVQSAASSGGSFAKTGPTIGLASVSEGEDSSYIIPTNSLPDMRSMCIYLGMDGQRGGLHLFDGQGLNSIDKLYVQDDVGTECYPNGCVKISVKDQGVQMSSEDENRKLSDCKMVLMGGSSVAPATAILPPYPSWMQFD